MGADKRLASDIGQILYIRVAGQQRSTAEVGKLCRRRLEGEISEQIISRYQDCTGLSIDPRAAWNLCSGI